MAIEKEKLVFMYRTMVRHREFGDRLAKEFAMGHIPGWIHLGQGQEAIGAGTMAALRHDDFFVSSHRGGDGHLIARGEKTELMWAEVFGKKTGLLKGKSGHMHLTNIDLGDLGVDGLLGITVERAVGAALSAKLRGTDQVTPVFFGDGVINTGGFHEALNMASTMKLPVIFILENNTWAQSTSIYDVTNLTKLTDRALGYNIPSVSIDGNDVLAVYETVSEAIEKARKGEGPTFIECKTCRWRGHYEGDTQTYRADRETKECMKKDPIPRFRKKLIEMGVLTDKKADKIHQEAVGEMDRGVKFALESPLPDPEDALDDVYA